MKLKSVGYPGLPFVKGPVTGWVFWKQTEYDMWVIVRYSCEKGSTEAELGRGRNRIVMQA